MSQEQFVTDPDLNAFAHALASARPGVGSEVRDRLLYATGFRAGRDSAQRWVRGWQATAALVALAAFGIFFVSPWTKRTEHFAAKVNSAEQPHPMVLPPTSIAPSPTIMAASPRWQRVELNGETSRNLLATGEPPADYRSHEPAVWTVGSALRLSGQLD